MRHIRRYNVFRHDLGELTVAGDLIRFVDNDGEIKFLHLLMESDGDGADWTLAGGDLGKLLLGKAGAVRLPFGALPVDKIVELVAAAPGDLREPIVAAGREAKEEYDRTRDWNELVRRYDERYVVPAGLSSVGRACEDMLMFLIEHEPQLIEHMVRDPGFGPFRAAFEDVRSRFVEGRAFVNFLEMVDREFPDTVEPGKELGRDPYYLSPRFVLKVLAQDGGSLMVRRYEASEFVLGVLERYHEALEAQSRRLHEELREVEDESLRVGDRITRLSV